MYPEKRNRASIKRRKNQKGATSLHDECYALRMKLLKVGNRVVCLDKIISFSFEPPRAFAGSTMLGEAKLIIDLEGETKIVITNQAEQVFSTLLENAESLTEVN